MHPKRFGTISVLSLHCTIVKVTRYQRLSVHNPTCLPNSSLVCTAAITGTMSPPICTTLAVLLSGKYTK